MTDEEMKEASGPGAAGEDKNGEDKEVEKEASPLEKLLGCIPLLEKSVYQKETRLLMGKILRQTATVRKALSVEVLSAFIKQVMPADYPRTDFLLTVLAEASSEMQTDVAPPAAVELPAGFLPEIEAYATFLVLLLLIDTDKYATARGLADVAVEWLSGFNRRTLDVLAARIAFYYSWAYEKTGELSKIRAKLHSLHRTATLRHDEIGQETLLNLLLRNYIEHDLYDLAEQLRSKTQRPETSRSNQQYCRYLYYLGRIRAIQLEYSVAKECLLQASRKAPVVAHGFRISVTKWLVLIRLLLGEVPERTTFAVPGMAKALIPYFELTQAVRAGDLTAFEGVASKHSASFARDGVRNLIIRLRHNVIRTGLRRIALAYSRIGLDDVAAKLGLPAGSRDTELIVAKAIRDGGIDAVIDHGAKVLCSRALPDAYSSTDPCSAFHDRIAFCLDLHNEAVKAMSYEAEDKASKLKGAEARRERLAQAEEELKKAMEEEEEEDDDMV